MVEDKAQTDAWISDHDLAWGLAGELQSSLADTQILWLYVDLGAGEHIAAVENMLKCALEQGIPLRNATIVQLRQWTQRYAGFDDVARIVELLPALTRCEGPAGHPARGRWRRYADEARGAGTARRSVPQSDNQSGIVPPLVAPRH
ncbi:hypothetical protein [Mycobacterium sp. SMC-4]|uniref:hypothetical protein n=1 Tax=Mycobacterium sp. SMC-4 TaxID=2857059 RepID=UPI003D05501A